MKFPADYPYSPPTIRFLTKVWHPNVYEVKHANEELIDGGHRPFVFLIPGNTNKPKF